jgi:type II secretory pathway pseudopilin PulG
MNALRRRCGLRPAFTLIELIVVVILAVLVAAILLPAIAPRRHGGTRTLKDSTQIRGIHQSMVTWAQNNADKYPLPSAIDKGDATLPADATGESGKDLTRHIMSLLIFQGFVSPELMISPSEANPGSVQRHDAYAFDLPPGAADPAKALWDPAFRASPIDDPIGPGQTASTAGNSSYAHHPPAGKRLARWTSTFNPAEPSLGNRGPLYAWSGKAWGLLPSSPFGDRSNTLLIHGSRSKWEGHIAYNDDHVAFEVRPDPESVLFSFTGLSLATRNQPDNLFMNEDDAARFPVLNAAPPDSTGRQRDTAIGAHANAYLKVITRLKADGSEADLWQD